MKYRIGVAFISSILLLASCGGPERPSSSREASGVVFTDETGVSYEQFEDGWHITDYQGNEKNIAIPQSKTRDGLTLDVTQIEANAFYGRSALEGIDLPSTLTTIGENAFFGTKLNSFYATANLAKVADNAFEETPFLKNASGSMLYLPTKNNPNCIAYKQLSTPTNLEVPQGLERVLDGAFEGASFANDNPVFSSVKYIGNKGFYKANFAYTVSFPEAIEVGEEAFANVPLTSISLPSVEQIGKSAFKDDTFLSQVALPKSLKSIGEGAFYNCESLKDLALPFLGPNENEGKGLSYLFGTLADVQADRIAGKRHKLTFDHLTVNGGKLIQNVCESDTFGIKSLTLEDIAQVPTYAFAEHPELEELKFDNVKRFDYGAFYSHSIKEIYIPTTTKIIGEKAFFSAIEFTINFEYTSDAVNNGSSIGIEYHVTYIDVGNKCTLNYRVPNPYKLSSAS